MNLWRYYFMDIPLWALGVRFNRHREIAIKKLHAERILFKQGLKQLSTQFNIEFDNHRALEKALLVKLIRNSDAYRCISYTKKNIHHQVDIRGLEHLTAMQTENRPIIMLTGHIGSFYCIPAVLSQLGINSNLLARPVDDSEHNPKPQQYFERLNYFLTEQKMLGRYIYTNYANKLDRRIVHICKENGILAALIDIPHAFFPDRHHPVSLLGHTTTLPVGVIDLGIKYKANFITVWNTIDIDSNLHYRHRLIIEPAFPETDNSQTVLQQYADRLSNIVSKQPWQWMGTGIIDKFLKVS